MEIIQFENGTLYFKLREDWDKDIMHVSCAIARISRKGLKIVKGDSGLEVSSNQMILTFQELKLIAEGYEMVRFFWKEAPLEPRHVLLACGCIHKWDDLEHNSFHVWCPDHEDVKVSRWNAEDWGESSPSDSSLLEISR